MFGGNPLAKTIAAFATNVKGGALGIIRISGENAVAVGDSVFRCAANGKSLANMKGYTAAYGHVFDKSGDIDDGVATVFRAPHSYTGEDAVEFSLHGGEQVMRQTLRAIFAAGAVQAQPGEFTKRAFLNGKMSLMQAEAVMDVIGASSSAALKAANAVKEGAAFQKIQDMKETLTYCAAQAAAYVDFPEEGLQEMDETGFLNKLNAVKTQLAALIAGYDNGAVIKSGIECVIVGKPNVGKSTLMNLLAGKERSIVTNIAGTTRDIVEETVEVGGILLRLSDTAGLREGGDLVESIGMERAKEKMKNAQLILAVFDAGEQPDDADISLLDTVPDTPKIIILNKTDLGCKVDASPFEKYGTVIKMSAATGEGAKDLQQAISKTAGLWKLDPDAVGIANERQLVAAKAALCALEDAIDAYTAGQMLDAVGILLDESIASLLELTGERVSDAVVDQVFANFCVGK